MFVFTGIAGWCTPGFAREAIGVGVNPLSVDGSNNGVDITGATTLQIDSSIVPVPDVDKNNSSLASVTPAITINANDFGQVVFNYSSTIYGDVGTSLAKLHLITVSDTMTANFMGNVYAAGAPYGMLVGSGAANFNSGSTNVTAVDFTNDGTITLSPNTKVIGALTNNTAGAQKGTLVLGSGSIWDGAVGGAVGLRAIKVIGGNNTAGVSATITGAVDAYSFALGTNTLNITGALTMATHTGDYTSGVGIVSTTLASPTVYGHIVMTGAAGIGAAVGLNVFVPATAYIPVGTQFNVIQAASGTGNSVISVHVDNPTNPLYTFTPVTQVHGQVTIETATIPMQTSSNPSVPVLAAIPATPDLSAVLAPLNALTDPVAINNAVAQLAPSTPSLAIPLVAFRGTRYFRDLWLSHFENSACDQVNLLDVKNSSCQDTTQHSGMWVKGFGYTGSQEEETGFTAYDAKTIGGMLAYDIPVSPETRIGVGVGYGQTMVYGKTFDAKTDFDTYQGTVYLDHNSGQWFLDGDLAFGWNDYTGMRHMQFPGLDRTADSKYSGQDYTAFVSTGYHIPFIKFTFTPLASLHYSRVYLEGYTETGAGDIDLKVQSQSYDFLESGLGMKVERPFVTRAGAYVPEVHAKWLHKIMNPTLEQKASYTAPGSTSFTTTGLNTADDTYNAGAGLTFLSCAYGGKTWSLEGVYDYEWTDAGYSAHQGMAKATVRF